MTTSSQNQKALVTGASGFVGRRLVDALLESGTNVTVLARPSSHLPTEWQGRVERRNCTEWTLDGFSRTLERIDFDVLYQLAAYGVNPIDRDSEQMLKINIWMPCDLVRVCKSRSVPMIMAGSNSEYSEPPPNSSVTEASPLETGKLYGTSKAAGGIMACALATDIGVKLRVLRLFNVYGPGEPPHRLLPNLIFGLKEGRRVPLTMGTQVRDFVYVDDAVEAFLAAAAQASSAKEADAAIWNVCTGIGHTVHDFALTVAQTVGADPKLLGFGEQKMRDNEVPWLVGNPVHIKRSLGWVARHDLKAGVRDAVARTMKFNSREGMAS